MSVNCYLLTCWGGDRGGVRTCVMGSGAHLAPLEGAGGSCRVTNVVVCWILELRDIRYADCRIVVGSQYSYELLVISNTCLYSTNLQD